eukprot:SAG11_NODE_17297_length_522_cov_1.099291_1_plen_46_part_10
MGRIKYFVDTRSKLLYINTIEGADAAATAARTLRGGIKMFIRGMDR